MKQEEVFIVVPVYNEDIVVLRDTLSALLKQFSNVVVIDDGSGGEIGTRIKDLPVHFLRHTVNLGQGAALQTGTEHALLKGALKIVHFDADGQHVPANISRMLQALQEGKADVVLGSRFINQKGKENMPLGRKVVLQFGRIVNLFITGLWLTDAHQGLRVMNRKAASLIILRENRQAHATEILLEIRKHRLRYLEMGVETIYTKYSLAKGQKSLHAFNIFIDLVLNKIFR
jgi:glycosyltransferase involved in cell wall biosynthesis